MVTAIMVTAIVHVLLILIYSSPPAFVGNNYYCESGDVGTIEYQLHIRSPLHSYPASGTIFNLLENYLHMHFNYIGQVLYFALMYYVFW